MTVCEQVINGRVAEGDHRSGFMLVTFLRLTAELSLHLAKRVMTSYFLILSHVCVLLTNDWCRLQLLFRGKALVQIRSQSLLLKSTPNLLSSRCVGRGLHGGPFQWAGLPSFILSYFTATGWVPL